MALCAISFGALNLYKFKKLILPQLTLCLFYVFTTLTLIMTIVLCWLDIRLWYEMDWLISNGLVRTFEISFAFCQTNAFIQLCYKLSLTMQETNFDESERNKRNKLFNIVLICGLIVFNAVFVFYIIYTMINTRGIEQDAEIGKPQFINLEICCWIVGMVSSAILISSIVYTIIKLNAMFPGQDI